MKDSELRIEVAKKLKEQKRIEGEDMPDATWDLMVELGYVEDAMERDFDEEAVQFLLDTILWINDARLSSRGSRKGAGRRAGNEEIEVRVRLDPSTAKRAEVFRDITATLAVEHPGVKSFREDVLDRQLLTHERASELLYGQEGPCSSELVRKRLNALGKSLSKAYRWDELDAKWFVLTDHPPPVLPVHTVASINYGGYPFQLHTATVTLVVEPWVSASEVARAYASIQNEMLDPDNNYRVKSERNLEILRFIVKKRAETIEDRQPNYKTLCKLWNRENPDQRMEYNRFWEAATRTEQAVLRPEYAVPERVYELSPAKSWRVEYHQREAEAAFKIAKRIGPPKLGKKP